MVLNIDPQRPVKRKNRKRAPFSAPAPVVPVRRPPPPSAGLVFVATFEDGTRTKMSVYSALDPLDLERGVAVSRAAYSSRTGTPMSAITTPIVAALFQTKDGVPLATYDAEQLKGANK